MEHCLEFSATSISGVDLAHCFMEWKPELLTQRLAKFGAPGLVNFTTAVDYHFCPSLPAALTQPGTSTLAHICRCIWFVTLFLGLYQWRHLRGHLLYDYIVWGLRTTYHFCHPVTWLQLHASGRRPQRASDIALSYSDCLPACRRWLPHFHTIAPFSLQLVQNMRGEGEGLGKGQNMCHVGTYYALHVANSY